MNLYMTSGTSGIYEENKNENPNEQMYLLHGTGNSLLIHETLGKTVFQVPENSRC